jgi:hypothetical protein
MHRSESTTQPLARFRIGSKASAVHAAGIPVLASLEGEFFHSLLPWRDTHKQMAWLTRSYESLP